MAYDPARATTGRGSVEILVKQGFSEFHRSNLRAKQAT